MHGVLEALQKQCDHDLKIVSIFMNSLLVRKGKEGSNQAAVPIPPAVLSFLDIKVENSLFIDVE